MLWHTFSNPKITAASHKIMNFKLSMFRTHFSHYLMFNKKKKTPLRSPLWKKFMFTVIAVKDSLISTLLCMK